ncbi:DNA-binding transcriptional regulator, LysR family [Paucidesulfovibrio gracilis DSM 16080]|uniref:DNA-binding transcriptional regulator, LysR family n=1 Tax=Paucidesulfovibrio gracilis DSM 16080 TaxID=1121449 RepID=A0A1T4X4D0_9BACT|nr:LysR substrate-binding domain-containing protein [Paucidesulfovibrio gracilis]SKA84503.1 DNA-binding transcriptional regulator, LysR family [Paucidesulfovibrio gracilis DSM 16080]
MQIHLDTELLRTLVTVVECRSFTKAARQLCRTQAAVSGQVKRLEKQVEQRLFERDSRHVDLTEAGETLLAYAREVLALNDAAVDALRTGRSLGAVRLGLPDDYASFFLPRVLEHYSRQWPDVQVEVCCELSVDLMPKFLGGELDLALVTRQPRSRGGEVVRRERLVWASACGGRAHLADPLPLAMFPPGYCAFRDAALERLRRQRRPYRVVSVSRSLSGIRATVSAGLAVTVVSENTVSSDMEVLDSDSGLPDLPSIDITLHGGDAGAPAHVRGLAEAVHRILGDPAGWRGGEPTTEQ